MDKKVKQIVDWIRERVKEANAKGVVVGLSGGLDSSCVAILCKKAFPENIKGIIMPCMSSPQDMEHAKMVAEKFGIPFEVVNLEESFKTFFKAIEGEAYNEEKHKGLGIANIKPRLRMAVLYYFTNRLNYLVVGTDNKSEEMTGYFTKYGDGGVDILPIVDLYKRDIRELSKHLGVPEEIITKRPSAGLWDNQTDEDELGISYDELDEILHGIEIGKDLSGFDSKKIEKVKHMIRTSEHKRKMPPACKIN